MNAQKAVVMEENRVKSLIEQISADKKMFSEFMETKDMALFARRHEVELAENEKQIMQAMQKSMKEAVHRGIAKMSDKVFKMSSIPQLCNGTCW